MARRMSRQTRNHVLAMSRIGGMRRKNSGVCWFIAAVTVRTYSIHHGTAINIHCFQSSVKTRWHLVQDSILICIKNGIAIGILVSQVCCHRSWHEQEHCLNNKITKSLRKTPNDMAYDTEQRYELCKPMYLFQGVYIYVTFNGFSLNSKVNQRDNSPASYCYDFSLSYLQCLSYLRHFANLDLICQLPAQSPPPHRTTPAFLLWPHGYWQVDARLDIWTQIYLELNEPYISS